MTRRRSQRSGLGIAIGLLSEKLAYLFEKALRLRVGFFPGNCGELLQQLALLSGKLGGRFDGNPNVLVSAASAMQAGDALSPQAEHLPALRTGRNFHLHLAIERRHLDLGPERSLGEGDRHLAENFGVLANENRVLLDMHHHIQVSRRPPALAWFPFPGEADARRGIHAGWDFDLYLRPRLITARSSAPLTRTGDHPARAAALIARPRDGEETLRESQLSGPSASWAAAQ